MMEKLAEMSDWLATMAASVEATNMCQNRGPEMLS
jgi:hypothetical protein